MVLAVQLKNLFIQNLESGVHLNTGRIKGASVLLVQLMEKKLLYLPCRHHIFEVVLRFNINDQLLHTNPELWSNNEEYLKSKKIVDGLKVTNDTAERGVKLITDYNSCITKEEDHK
ncbi:hypothetical protein HELRODRAFT_159175 [Helobdella robusta]|uniref:Uncharacterized protein n=1 Tax=Helobdella robusta TaxID=6412 RepID=T1ENP6_HELRO|nr:hypothetical protein HELRODRAFT_159175 [Helobdella robusta]ESO12608.1 hypothetical protein HELRODRAFT_159175 [Helobdella robusta]